MVKLVEHPMTRHFDLCTGQFKIFSRFLAKVEVDFWCIQAQIKKREMDTTLSKRHRSQMRYRYFVHFRHGILVFANFSYGIAVLGTPQCPPPEIRGDENLYMKDVLQNG